MSTHVVPEAERRRHELTMQCPCRPVHQAALDLGLHQGPGRARAGQGGAGRGVGDHAP